MLSGEKLEYVPVSGKSVEYKVVVKGGVLPGHERDTVAEELAVMLDIDSDEAQLYFDGKEHTVQDRTDLSSAVRFQTQLQAIGAEASIVALSAGAVEPVPEDEDEDEDAAEAELHDAASEEEAVDEDHDEETAELEPADDSVDDGEPEPETAESGPDEEPAEDTPPRKGAYISFASNQADAKREPGPEQPTEDEESESIARELDEADLEEADLEEAPQEEAAPEESAGDDEPPGRKGAYFSFAKKADAEDAGAEAAEDAESGIEALQPESPDQLAEDEEPEAEELELAGRASEEDESEADVLELVQESEDEDESALDLLAELADEGEPEAEPPVLEIDAEAELDEAAEPGAVSLEDDSIAGSLEALETGPAYDDEEEMESIEIGLPGLFPDDADFLFDKKPEPTDEKSGGAAEDKQEADAEAAATEKGSAARERVDEEPPILGLDDETEAQKKSRFTLPTLGWYSKSDEEDDEPDAPELEFDDAYTGEEDGEDAVLDLVNEFNAENQAKAEKKRREAEKKAEAERKAREEEERKRREEEERIEAERRAKEEEEQRRKEEEERAEAERIAREEEEARRKEEEERLRKEEEERAEAERIAREEEEERLRQEEEERAEAERIAREEEEERLRKEEEERAEAERIAREEEEARRREEEERAEAERIAREEEEARLREEEERAEAERIAKEEEEARLREEKERAEAEAEDSDLLLLKEFAELRDAPIEDVDEEPEPEPEEDVEIEDFELRTEHLDAGEGRKEPTILGLVRDPTEGLTADDLSLEDTAELEDDFIDELEDDTPYPVGEVPLARKAPEDNSAEAEEARARRMAAFTDAAMSPAEARASGDDVVLGSDTEAEPGSTMLCPSCNTLQPRGVWCPACGAEIELEPAAARDTRPAAPKSLDTMSFVLAAAAAGLGAWGWPELVNKHNFEFGFVLPAAIGCLVGLASAITGVRGFAAGVVCAVLALVGIAGGKYILLQTEPVVSSAEEAPRPQPQIEWTEARARAWYKEAQIDAQVYVTIDGSVPAVRKFMRSRNYTNAKTDADVTEEELQYFYDVDSKDIAWMVEQQPSFEAWSERMRDHLSGRQRASLQRPRPGATMLDEVFRYFSMVDLIFLFIGLVAAFRLGSEGLFGRR